MADLVMISGGQTGVDLAALYAAEACSIPYIGWVPLHFTNETGEYGIPERFRPFLRETSTTESAERTEKNTADADGILTLLFEQVASTSPSLAWGRVSPGTLHGIDYAKKLGKREDQLCFVNLATSDMAGEKEKVLEWLVRCNVTRCAIGGPRESEQPGIQEKATIFLKDALQEYKKRGKLPSEGPISS